MSTANAKLGDYLEELLNIGIALSRRRIMQAVRTDSAGKPQDYQCRCRHLVFMRAGSPGFRLFIMIPMGIYQGGQGDR